MILTLLFVLTKNTDSRFIRNRSLKRYSRNFKNDSGLPNPIAKSGIIKGQKCK